MQKSGLLKRAVLDLNRSYAKRHLAASAGSGSGSGSGDKPKKESKGFFSFFEPKKIQVTDFI